MNLDHLLKPKSIAVVGVSNDLKKLGSVIFNNIMLNGFKGKVYPINPKYDEVLGHKCYPSINSINVEIDLAVIVTPAHTVINILEEMGRKKVKSVIIISAGFSETGKEGLEKENEIKEIAKKYGIIILGPNCLGLINTNSYLNASFAQYYPEKGNIAFLSQSGAIGTALLDYCAKRKLGLSQFISIGNKAGVDEVSLLENWLGDPDIKVIGVYIEEFSRGIDFIETAMKSKKKKPIIVLHPGSSKAGKEAIASHTGSVAGESILISVALKKAGIIEVKSIEDMFNHLMIFSWSESPNTNFHDFNETVAIITNAGGPGIMVTDLLSEKGIKLTALSETTKEKIKKVLPDSASIHNPIDLIGDADAKRYEDVLSILSESLEVNNVLVVLTPQAVTQIEETAKVIINYSKHKDLNVFPLFIGGEYIQSAIDRFKENKIPFFKYDEDCVDSLNSYISYQSNLEKKKEYIYSNDVDAYNKSVKRQIKDLEISDSPKVLSEELTLKLLDEFNLSKPITLISTNLEEIIEFIKKNESIDKEGNFKNRYVLKATSEDVYHKTDFKAVMLNINSLAKLKSDYEKLVTNILNYKIKAGIDTKKQIKIILQEMVVKDVELFIGIKRDGDSKVYENKKGFGHSFVFGTGGIYTEVLKDLKIGLLPLNTKDFEGIISSTKVGEIIEGARGLKKLNKKGLLEFLIKLQNMIFTYPEIHTIDINPLMINDERVVALDFKVIVRK